MKFASLSGSIDPQVLRASDKTLYPTLKTRDFQKVLRATDPLTGQRFRWSRGAEYHYTHGSPEFDGGHKDCLYWVNSDGTHGPDNVANPDVLALGCSITSGMGLPYNFTWPDICRSVLGKTVNSVARAGSSIDHQVYRAFGNMRKYGLPKSIWILSPDIFRGQLAVGPDDWYQRTLLYDHSQNGYTTIGYEPYVHQSLSGEKTLIPVDVIVDKNLKSLEMLIMFAEASDIDVRLFSWHDQTLDCFRQCGYECVVDPPSWVALAGNPQSDEHSEMLSFWEFPASVRSMGGAACCDLYPIGYWQEKAWTVALDQTESWLRPHPGFHSQIHFAETLSRSKIQQEDVADISPWFEGTDLEPKNP